MINIDQHLAEIERTYKIKIILAVENGARNWGLASPISDYDIRFIYSYPIKRYVSLTKPKPTIDFQKEAERGDFHGFDLYKFAELMSKSNANLIEWLTSSIVYRDYNSPLINMAREFIHNQFNPMAIYYHYHAMGYNNFSKFILRGKKVTPKTYLYAIRGLFNALYVLEFKKLPPNDFEAAISETKLIPREIAEIVLGDLIPAKRHGLQGNTFKRNTTLDVYLDNTFRQRKHLHQEAKEEMKRKMPLPNNIDDLLYDEMFFTFGDADECK